MAGQAELFTVCSSCGQQVSTFVTECPYCGTRLRQRAPRLDRKDGDLEALLRLPSLEPDRTLREGDEGDEGVVVPFKRRRGLKSKIPRPGPRPSAPSSRKAPKVPRADRAPKSAKAPRASRIPGLGGRLRRTGASSGGYASEGKAYATAAIVLLSLLFLPLNQLLAANDLVLTDDSPLWRSVTAALTYGSSWNALAVLTTIGVFGWLWERRAGVLGSIVVLVAFLGAGVGGLLLDLAVDPAVFASGAAGTAIALSGAWIVCEIRDRRAGQSLDGDLQGAAVLMGVPIATTALTADTIPASIGLGLIVAAVLGLALSLARR